MADTTSHTSKDTQTILDALRCIVQVLRRSSAYSERTVGLTSAQLFILKSLQVRSGCSINELAAYVHASQSTVSEAVARLVSRGLVKRSHESRDRRRVELSLTEDGTNVIASGNPMPQDELVSAIAAMSEVQRIALADGLTTLVAAVGMGDVAPQLFFEEILDLS
ncbi:MAG: winged helix-turn-helix transcriptional regulator [Ramlibacter sp.]|jgi:DNA-binding MarR family transcriptional regulator|nr:winged helix-turn-helix transcriptional regulator [Ramlibacter sp.]MCW5648217.1 winged helix-turn-helix transcriptional regulator [Ramlibacter sp.]